MIAADGMVRAYTLPHWATPTPRAQDEQLLRGASYQIATGVTMQFTATIGQAGVPSRLANLDSSMDVDLVYATGSSESLGYHSSRNGERVTFHMRLDESPPPPPPFGGVDSSALAQEEAEITAVAWGVDSRFMVMLAMLLGVVLGGVLVCCALKLRAGLTGYQPPGEGPDGSGSGGKAMRAYLPSFGKGKPKEPSYTPSSSDPPHALAQSVHETSAAI